MSDPFDSMELPDELREVASHLRGLRPVAPAASQAECMYRAGWQAALSAHCASRPSSARSWNKTYLGGLVSGAVAAGALTAIFILGTAKTWNSAARDLGDKGSELVGPASDATRAEHSDSPLASALPSAQSRAQAAASPSLESSAQSSGARRESPEDFTLSMPALTDDLRATALLSPVARQQWRGVLTQAALPYALPRSASASSSVPRAEPLRSSPRSIDRTWF